MFTTILQSLKTACLFLLLCNFFTGLIYPLLTTGLAQLFFPWKANGSLITLNDKIIGSKYIGQSFTSPQFFQGRPSATPGFPYNAMHSSGSNLAPTNPLLLTLVSERIANLQRSNPNNHQPIPLELVTSSASGLDPHISPNAAYYQVARIAQTRGITEASLNTLVKENITHPYLGFIGEPYVNVLKLNLALETSLENTGERHA